MLAADKDGKQIFEGVLPYNIKKILDNKAYAYFEVEMKSGKIKISKEVNDNF